MNGVHDVAGVHGFGPVAVGDGDAFHDEWEKCCFGLRVAMQRGQGITAATHEERYVRELLPPHVYLGAAYYERSLLAGEQIFDGRGVLTARYVRGRRGVVDRLHGAFDLPELAAVGEHRPEHVYEARFEGEELWGESAEPNACVYAQLWESCLLPA